MSKIETRTIYDASNPHTQIANSIFFVKDYQRGYRWEKSQIEALLNDILEFDNKSKTVKYCLQPLVVKELVLASVNAYKLKLDNLDKKTVDGFINEKCYELIDGQQRLTTLLLIINSCNDALKTPPPSPFDIYYELLRTVDRSYIDEAMEIIEGWFSDFGSLKDTRKTEILNKIKEDIMFVWYEVDAMANSNDIFEKLNVGKIELTNAELFKALLLNPDNVNSNQQIDLQKIALEWDALEQKLRDDNFWYFISNNNKSPETRIDFLLNLFALNKVGTLNADKLFSFLVVQKHVKNEVAHKKDKFEVLEEIWETLVLVSDMLFEWFDDKELHNKIGYLVSAEKSKTAVELIQYLVKNCEGKTKADRLNVINTEIKKSLKSVSLSALDYERSADKDKIRKVLLYFNIATMNRSKTDAKFSFRLYKIQKWDIEHIHARATDSIINKITDAKAREEFLLGIRKQFEDIADDNSCYEIDEYIKKELPNNPIADAFLNFYTKLVGKYGDFSENGLGNLVLLDAETNREYQNALFPTKRKTIIQKDKGEVFIPVCTKNVFLKMYSTVSKNNLKWDLNDAALYFTEIEKLLAKEEKVCQ